MQHNRVAGTRDEALGNHQPLNFQPATHARKTRYSAKNASAKGYSVLNSSSPRIAWTRLNCSAHPATPIFLSADIRLSRPWQRQRLVHGGSSTDWVQSLSASLRAALTPSASPDLEHVQSLKWAFWQLIMLASVKLVHCILWQLKSRRGCLALRTWM